MLFRSNADSISDLIVVSLDFIDANASIVRPTLWAFSGADASLLWSSHIATNTVTDRLNVSVRPILTPDLTGDGTPDVVLTVGNILVTLSGADGTAATTWTPAGDTTLGKYVGLTHDLDGDGLPDLAVGIPGVDPEFDTRVVVVSSATGAALRTLRAPLEDSELGNRAVLGRTLAVADLDGDGRTEIVATFQHSEQDFTFSRDYVFDGDLLGETTYTGLTAGEKSRSIAWGTIGDKAFIVRDGVMTIMSDLAGFNDGEVIIDLFESYHSITIVGANADGSGTFIWQGDFALQDVERHALAEYTVNGSPSPIGPNFRAVAVTDQHVLIEQLFAGSHFTWLADIATRDMTFLFEGTPVDIARTLNSDHAFIIAINPDEPNAGIYWRDGAITALAFRPVALSSDGNRILGVQPSATIPPSNIVTFSVGLETLTTVPLPEGEDFTAIGINRFGDVVGTYTTPDQQRSAFSYNQDSQETVDIRADVVFGDPDEFATTSIDRLFGISDWGDVLINQDGTDAILTVAHEVLPPGPIRAGDASSISLAVSPNGALRVLSLNEAGEVISFFNAFGTGFPRGGQIWFATKLHEFLVTGQITSYVSWHVGFSNSSFIAFATPDGVFLLSPPVIDDVPPFGTVRNLTEEIAGSEPIATSLVTLRPQNGLQLLAGLTADGELVLYGETANTTPEGEQIWAYDNLYESVLGEFPFAPPDLRSFDGILTPYVTSWDGLNIAGVNANGQPIVFWTAPGIVGWRMTNLFESTTGLPPEAVTFRSLHVALTPWNGINLYGESGVGGEINAIWWVPEFEGTWSIDHVVDATSDTPDAAHTLTAFATSWGGLNIARVDTDGKVEVFWWTPETNLWQRDVLNYHIFPGFMQSVRFEGRLASAVSNDDVVSVVGRNSIGDLFRFYWSLDESWQVERI